MKRSTKQEKRKQWRFDIGSITPATPNYAGPIRVELDMDEKPTVLLWQSDDGYNDMIGLELPRVDALIAALYAAKQKAASLAVETKPEEKVIPPRPIVTVPSGTRCRGCYGLGTACGKCESCADQWQKMFGGAL